MRGFEAPRTRTDEELNNKKVSEWQRNDRWLRCEPASLADSMFTVFMLYIHNMSDSDSACMNTTVLIRESAEMLRKCFQ